MKRYPSDRLRNVALIGHGGAGKTQLAEALLHTAGVTSRFGRVDDGNTLLDFDPDEIERKMSVQLGIAPLIWREHRITLLDTPGYFDFIGEVHAALRAVEAAIVVCDAVAGVEVGTELVWRLAERAGLARMVFVSKLDREHADFEKTIEQLAATLGRAIVPLELPIGREADLCGVVDLLTGEARIDEGGRVKVAPAPAELAERVAELRTELLERIAETDESLLERYLEGEALPVEQWRRGLRAAVRRGEIVPVLCGAGLSGVGAAHLLDAIVDLVPSPADVNPAATGAPDEPFSALVFKTLADPYIGRLSLFKVLSGTVASDSTVYNSSRDAVERVGQLLVLCGKQQAPIATASAGEIVALAKLQHTQTGDTLCSKAQPVRLPPIEFPEPVFSVAVEPRAKGDEDKISAGLARLAEEDPTFRVERNHETKQTLLYGMGELHLSVLTARLARKFGVQVDLTTPRVPYRETITRTVTAEYKHKKQSGGRGQYGHVFIRLEPLPRGEGFAFGEEIFGGAVPRQYIPAVEKGVVEAMAEGVLAGYPVTDVKVVLYDGSYHSVDSSELAFKIAAAQAFRKGFREAAPVLLEPIVTLEVIVPEAYMGDVMGDLNKRRGRILGMEPRGSAQAIRAHVPLAETFTYAADLRSMTQGRGTYTLNFSHYEEVPEAVARQVIEAGGQARAKASG